MATRGSNVDADYLAMDDDDSNRRDGNGTQAGTHKEKEHLGVNFPRISGIVVFTFIIVIIALIIDNLSFHGNKTDYEGTNETKDITVKGTCEVKGTCGWSRGSYTYERNGTYPNCPDSDDYEISYKKYCDDGYNMDCKAVDAGNVWLAFCILSLLISIPLMVIILPLLCRKKVLPDRFDKHTKRILIVLSVFNVICQFIAPVVWMALDLCDEADPYFNEAFDFQSPGTPGYSTVLVLVCFVANLIGTLAMCFCWEDKTRERPGKQHLPHENL